MSKNKNGRPAKPRPDFPLFPHATGRWAKKIRGKFHYFGKVTTDPKGQAALAKWLDQKDDLLAGRVPRPKVEGVTIRNLCNAFLSRKKDLLDSGELNAHTFQDAYGTCQRIGQYFGWDRLIVDVVADDFDGLRRQLAKQWGPARLAVEVGRIHSLFRYALDAGLIVQAVRFGPHFRGPSRRVLRLARAEKGVRMFEAAELRAILTAAKQPLRAMILLAANCGFGNSDLAHLPTKAVNLKTGWVDFPRGKTGIGRRCPLWPETVAAVRQALDQRPTPSKPVHRPLAFIMPNGEPWAEVTHEHIGEGRVEVRRRDAIGKAFDALIRNLKLHRAGLGLYAIRHTFETIGGDSRDQVAVDAIMGHTRDDMASVYRERIDESRLLAVVNHVRQWLFGETKQE
jgi:integrase